jgi:hypothetical protein
MGGFCTCEGSHGAGGYGNLDINKLFQFFLFPAAGDKTVLRLNGRSFKTWITTRFIPKQSILLTSAIANN